VSAYPPIIKELKQYEVKLIDEALVIDKNIATASSCLAGQYLSGWIMTTLVGEEVAKEVMKTVEPLGHHRLPSY
jgi:hypothetical protein